MSQGTANDKPELAGLPAGWETIPAARFRSPISGSSDGPPGSAARPVVFAARLADISGMSAVSLRNLPARSSPDGYDVRDFGATGDGRSIDSDAINAAIVAAADAGGGTVRLPAGTYRSYSIRLRSGVRLHLEAGATLLAAAPGPGIGGYDPPEPNAWGEVHGYQDFGHSHWHNSLIWGEDLHDIAITGPGRIDGTHGLVREAGLHGASSDDPGEAADGPPPPPADPAAIPAVRGGGAGNKAIALKRCRNVVLRDLTLRMCGHFAVLASGVDQLTIEHLQVDTNRDGIDLDGCRDVRIAHCRVNAPGDDAIVLKSSYALGEARACENIIIEHCRVSGYDAGTFLGGTPGRTLQRAIDGDGPTGRIKFGTESNGGFKRIRIFDVEFERSRGLALETVDGGDIEDIVIEGVVMREVTTAPIFIRLGHRLRGPGGTRPGVIRRVQIRRVTVHDADPRYPSIIAGVPGHPVEEVQLSEIRVAHRGGLTLAQVAEQPAEMVNPFFLGRRDATIARDPFCPPERAAAYPEPSMFGLLPAHGLYVRHAKHLSVRDLEVRFEQSDERPAVVLEDVTGVTFEGMQAQRSDLAPVFVLRDVQDFSAQGVQGILDTQCDRVQRGQL